MSSEGVGGMWFGRKHGQSQHQTPKRYIAVARAQSALNSSLSTIQKFIEFLCRSSGYE